MVPLSGVTHGASSGLPGVSGHSPARRAAPRWVVAPARSQFRPRASAMAMITIRCHSSARASGWSPGRPAARSAAPRATVTPQHGPRTHSSAREGDPRATRRVSRRSSALKAMSRRRSSQGALTRSRSVHRPPRNPEAPWPAGPRRARGPGRSPIAAPRTRPPWDNGRCRYRAPLGHPLAQRPKPLRPAAP